MITVGNFHDVSKNLPCKKVSDQNEEIHEWECDFSGEYIGAYSYGLASNHHDLVIAEIEAYGK